MLMVAQWAMPQLVAAGKKEYYTPAFLVTSGGLYKNPFPAFVSFPTPTPLPSFEKKKEKKTKTKKPKKEPPQKNNNLTPPKPQQFSLASCKAAQYNLLHSLHKEYGPKGVHCAALVVEGKVSEEAQVTTPKNIALEAWKLFEEPAPGELDATIQDPEYLEWVKKVEG